MGEVIRFVPKSERERIRLKVVPTLGSPAAGSFPPEDRPPAGAGADLMGMEAL